MKKILLVLVAVLAMCAVPTQAARMFLAQPNQMLALQEEVNTDTTVYSINRAACSYHADGNQKERYYMIMSFYGAAGTSLPQVQYHILTKDTLCITREDNILIRIAYIEQDGSQVDGVDGKFTIEFVEFDASQEGFAAYDCSLIAVLQDGRVLKGEYHDVIRFYNADPHLGPLHPYIPTNEPWTSEGFEQNEAAAAPVKVLRNGQVLIVREGRMYDLCGRVVSLKN